MQAIDSLLEEVRTKSDCQKKNRTTDATLHGFV